MNLTIRQNEILEYIKQYIRDHGIAPTVDEIRLQLHLNSLATIHKHLKAIEARGKIRRGKFKARAIEILSDERTNPNEIPMFGKIAAGQPIEALPMPETITIPDDMLGKNLTFSLQVKGDSMIDDGIHNGDYIVVESRESAKEGEIVVALVDGSEATVKRYYKKGKSIRLQPSNPTMEPIILDAARVAIQGVVIGLIRKYKKTGK
jgi:repressor LexA